jgi:hypothetical protein
MLRNDVNNKHVSHLTEADSWQHTCADQTCSRQLRITVYFYVIVS